MRWKVGVPSKTIRTAILAACLSSLSACAALSPRTTPLALSAASAGIAATDAALNSYEHLDGLYAAEIRNRHTGDLIAGRPISLVQLSPDEQATANRRSAAIQARITATRDLQETYRAFQRLAGGTYGKDTSAAVAQFNTTLEAVAKAQQIPISGNGPIPGIVGPIAELAINAIQARDLKRHNRVLADLVHRYRQLWNQDLPVWDAAIDSAYVTELAPTIVGLPDNKFDMSAVSKAIPDPFSPDIKLKLYRNQVLADAAAQAAQAKAPLHKVSKALGSVEDAHEELAKDQPSLIDVAAYIDNALTLAKSAEKEPANAGSK